MNLKVEEGEIHALIGENGAGKSTLMNVLSGTYPAGSYSGEIYYDGKLCQFKNQKDSEAVGIVIIHQELALIPLLSIGENMFLGNEIKNKFGFIDWNKTYYEAEQHMKQVGLNESAQTLVKDIGTGKQQLVEIAKAFSKKVRLLILDEPTSSLNDEDAKMLLDLLMEFKKQGLTSIIITHKLNEIIYCADKATIIRDGSTIETLVKGVDEFSEDRIIKGMVGRAMEDRYPKREHKVQDTVSMEVKNWTVHHPLYPERVVDDNISFNTTLARLDKVCGGGIIDTDKEVQVADQMTKEMGTKTPTIEQRIGNLSGGNQQKALLGKWMFTEPDILIMDEPTRGIDVGAKYDIYCLINDMVSKGKSVVMISSELPELLGMCDRIYVMNEGRLLAEVNAADATQESIMGYIIRDTAKA